MNAADRIEKRLALARGHWELNEREDRGGNFHQQPSDNGVGNRHSDNVSSL